MKHLFYWWRAFIVLAILKMVFKVKGVRLISSLEAYVRERKNKRDVDKSSSGIAMLLSNGHCLVYLSEFVLESKLSSLVFVIGHELGHAVLEHNGLRVGRNISYYDAEYFADKFSVSCLRYFGFKSKYDVSNAISILFAMCYKNKINPNANAEHHPATASRVVSIFEWNDKIKDMTQSSAVFEWINDVGSFAKERNADLISMFVKTVVDTKIMSKNEE